MKKSVSILLSATMLTSIPLTAVSHADSQIKEVISSNDRYETSIQISKDKFKSSDYVILASGINFPDALSGGVLAGYLKSPVLLVGPKGLTENLKKEIKRLSPKKIYILGGTKMISSDLEKTLNKNIPTARIAGPNRYDTSLLIAKELQKLGANKKISIADGKNYPDALAASGAMAKEKTPLVLVNGSDFSKIDTSNVKYIFGGKLSIDKDITGAKRIFGKNRYETSVEIAKNFYPNSRNVLISSGENYPDALSATSVSAIYDSPILLTKSSSVPAEISKYLKDIKPSITIIGGENSVNKGTVEKVFSSSNQSTEANTSTSGSNSNRHSSSSGTSVVKTPVTKQDILNTIDQLEKDLKVINVSEYVAEPKQGENVEQATTRVKGEIAKKLADFRKQLNSSNTNQETLNKIYGELTDKHGIIGGSFILSPYGVYDISGKNLVQRNVVKSKNDSGEKNKFSRIKADFDGKYRFKINTNHKGYLLNTAENKGNKENKKLLGFTYVTEDGYTNPKLKDGQDKNEIKKFDTDISQKVNVDVVTNPTPRYNRASLTEKTDVNNSNVVLKEVSGGYEVELSNLPEKTIIVKPVFVYKVSDKTKLEYGDMIFIDKADQLQHILNLAKADIDDIQNGEYQNQVEGEGSDVSDIINGINNEITELSNLINGNTIPVKDRMYPKHGLVASKLILKGYQVKDAGYNTVVENAVKSKKSDNEEVGRFARISKNSSGEYKFKIVTENVRYVLNTKENKNNKKLLAFTYVTKDGYNDPKIKDGKTREEVKKYDTSLKDKTQNVDVVTNPTPRYNRDNLIGKSDITIDESSPGNYVVTVKNLPKNTLIIKPVFLGTLPSGNVLEHGDMIFIDQSQN